MLIRGEGLAASMSSYLIERIAAHGNIALHTHSEIVALEGDDEGVTQVRVRDALRHEEADYEVRRVFLFIGADPNTEWLNGSGVAVDQHGFIRTGHGIGAPRAADPCLPDGMQARATLQTSVPGVFAIGDVRAGSIKRVAAAVGEGAAVVAQLHEFLAHQGAADQVT
jgi:thioredoxin reductase (NADPH)